jgi:hypothetical protein
MGRGQDVRAALIYRSSGSESNVRIFRSRRFNIYIYDYCFKRGFRKTARELLTEAGIPPDSNPPINARQGLLFEYVPSA